MTMTMTDKVFGPLFLSSFDAANEEWYEEMVRGRDAERWSREAWEKNKEALESLLNSSGDEGKVGPE